MEETKRQCGGGHQWGLLQPELLGKMAGEMAVDKRNFFAHEVISTLRGPVVTAVTAVQRAFRRKRYVKWYTNTKWNIFVKDVVAWINSECRYFRKRKHDPFGESVMPTWGYVPAPAVAAWRTLIVPPLGHPPRPRRGFPRPRRRPPPPAAQQSQLMNGDA